MESILKHAHSGMRWFALGLLIYAIVNAIMKKKNFSGKWVLMVLN